MKKYLALLAAAFLQTSAWAATYTFTGTTYVNLLDYTAPCAAGTCVNFSTVMRQTGHFTTNQPLPANQVSLDIAPLITWYDFNDGVTSYSMNGPDICHSYADDGAPSHGFAHGSGGWTSDVPVVGPGGAQSVPVDNPFALVLTAVGLLGLALRGRQKLLLKR